MFDIASSHIVLLAAVALVVIGPKDLPRTMHMVGKWIGRARGMARHFRVGLDEIVRQAELDEMQKKWAAENARIMAEHPLPVPAEEVHDAHFAAAPAMTAQPTPPQPAPAEPADVAPAPGAPHASVPVGEKG
jgi:sec-independent protein translocase protein TatB